jgi:serine/threonine-protein kinase RsbW
MPASRKHFVPSSPTELTFTGPARPECLDAIHDLLNRLWYTRTGVGETDRAMFAMAVLEIANNIVRHTNPDSTVLLSVSISADSDALRAEFRDDGSPAAVDTEMATLPDTLAESGRGLALARMALDEFRYERTQAQNRWQLERRIGNEDRGHEKVRT